MNIEESLGFYSQAQGPTIHDDKVVQYINLKLAALGSPTYGSKTDSGFLEIAQPLISSHQEKDRLLATHLCPADRRIQAFLDDYLGESIGLPTKTFILDRHGLARMLSLPPNRDEFVSPHVRSNRVRQGVLHNPQNDRRTTQGAFHVVEGGLPIPDDKIAVPKAVFAKLLKKACESEPELMQLPFTSAQTQQAELFVSLLMRPIVCPEVAGIFSQKTTEIRFFAPGSLVSNLDFVESIFGNAGDPSLPENDAGLDVEHWTGQTGCVILAPQLTKLRKKDLGLPNISKATARQKRDGLCWAKESELYNDGHAFKLTARDERGVMVTLIADNYFGYCKKEVKTQISFAANLYGLTEEEHSGGAIAFPSYDLGEEFSRDSGMLRNRLTFKEMVSMYGKQLRLLPQGYAIDRKYPNIVYVPEDASFNLRQQSISWTRHAKDFKIPLLKGNTYLYPSGYRVHMEKPMRGNWRLVGSVGEGTLCHKPCTVSGGGKSEISKSIAGSMIQGPIFTSDFDKDFLMIAEIMRYDFGDRFRKKFSEKRSSRPILSPKRSLGSVIKLFTPSSEYTDEYNSWLKLLPPHIREMIYVIKRNCKPEWQENWRDHFSVDMINGHLGHELKYNNEKIIAHYLRVGHEKNGSWRIYKLRQDFAAAEKLQVEDDITASVVIPAYQLKYLDPEYKYPSVKIVENCEYRLFQRPDDAIYRGMDHQAELDLSSPNTFLSNFEPLSHEQVTEIVQDAVGYDQYTQPVRDLITEFVKEKRPEYLVVSSHPRLVNGKPSKNPRYLQNRPDMADPRKKYLAEMATRLIRKIPSDQPLTFCVDAVLPGRRNNPPDAKQGIPPLALYNPIHYQELPELFIDFISSVTGKSPSTTSFGSEGALTKGPFNALWPVVDLNNALVSCVLTGYDGFSSAAGYVGPNYKVDHDISFLIPEIWCRMTVAERDPKYLIKEGYLEKVNDFKHEGKLIQASLLGYRITIKFVNAFLGRIFNNPDVVFSEEMLAPEKQDLGVFVEGLNDLVATEKRVADHYFKDGSIEAACPPLQALLHIMVSGKYQGKDRNHADIRRMFRREEVLKSVWYQDRLKAKQLRDIKLWKRHVKYLEDFMGKQSNANTTNHLELRARLRMAHDHLKHIQSNEYLKSLVGTIGADPLTGQVLAPKTATLITSRRS